MSAGYWLLSAILVIYVALCTGNRDVIPSADAWEHHRTIAALEHQLWKPGNPTVLSDVPSIRYSPYFLAQAVIARATHVDAYRILSCAAALNTLLLCVGLWMFLSIWGERQSALLALLCIIGLWGVAPGYAGTTALADLPWHAVNPSAFSFATGLIALALVKSRAKSGGMWKWGVAGVICVCAMLDHPMTGAFLLLAMFISGVIDNRSLEVMLGAFVIGVVALLACIAWPWYPFMTALRMNHDRAYWFNPTVTRLMITAWCLPALLFSLAALQRLDLPAVRVGLAVGAAGFLCTLSAILVKSPTFARFLMPATVFMQIAIGTWAARSGVLTFSAWKRVCGDLYSRVDQGRIAQGVLLIFFSVAMLYGLVPQLISVVREPQLARPLIARLVKIEDKQRHLKPIYDQLLAGVGPLDVVLADSTTGWAVPSSNGRIVAVEHYERFVLDQPLRTARVEEFFTPETADDTRRRLIHDYQVRWILLNLDIQPERTAAWLRAHCPEKSRVGNFILLDATPLS